MVFSSFLLFLEDLFKKTSILKYYRSFHSSSSLSAEEIREIQNEKLRKLIAHAYNNIVWYREKMVALGIKPEDIRDVKDLSSLPILSRDDIRDQAEKLCWESYTKKIVKNSSSGTTGIPIAYFHDLSTQSAGIAACHVLSGFSGWKPGLRNVHIWGNSTSIKTWGTFGSKIKQLLYSRRNIPSTLFGDLKKLPAIVNKIQKFKPSVIDGYPNSIYELACYIAKNKIKLDTVKLVITTAENLEEYQKEIIEKSIGPVSDLYGCGEINGIASKPTNESCYFILDPHVVVESIPIKNQSLKEIVVTDLDNYYMPLIRYKIGDMIDEVHPGSDENILPYSYFTRIYGRSSSPIVLPSGKSLITIGLFGGTLFRQYPSIKRHKTIWNGKKLTFLFEVNGSIDLNALEEEIQKSLEEYDVEFELKSTIKIHPDKSGKYIYFEKV